MTTEPRPCPICGGPAATHQARWEGERSYVQCRPCRLVMGGAPREHVDSIVERWNVRAPHPAKAPT